MQVLAGLMFCTLVLCHAYLTMGVQEEGKDGTKKNNTNPTHND